MRFICYVFVLLYSGLYSQEYNIIDYGAIGDGSTLNTAAIQRAIDTAQVAGGGKVIIPSGLFLTGSISLKSGVELHLEKDATLLGSTKFQHHQKVERFYQRALIMARDQDDIAITGSGTIDGQGREAALLTDSLFKAGILDMKYYNQVELRPRFYMRPMLIVLVGCNKVKISDVQLKNSASWVQHYDRCTNLTITGIRVESDAYWNNDGLDISDSKNVYVADCYINSADDGICLKSHYVDELLEDVVIENCTVRSSASAIKFGTKSEGGFRNVTIKNIKIFDTYRSAVAIESVDGGSLENIKIDSIEATNTGNALFIKLGHREAERQVGSLKNVSISNMKIVVAFERPDYAYEVRGPALPFFHNTFPSSITGMPGYKVENVTLENIEINYPGRGNKAMAYASIYMLDSIPENYADYPEFSMFGELPAWGLYIRHVAGLTMKNIKLSIRDPDYRPAIVIDKSQEINMEKLHIKGDNKTHNLIYRKTASIKTDKPYKLLHLDE